MRDCLQQGNIIMSRRGKITVRTFLRKAILQGKQGKQYKPLWWNIKFQYSSFHATQSWPFQITSRDRKSGIGFRHESLHSMMGPQVPNFFITLAHSSPSSYVHRLNNNIFKSNIINNDNIIIYYYLSLILALIPLHSPSCRYLVGFHHYLCLYDMNHDSVNTIQHLSINSCHHERLC